MKISNQTELRRDVSIDCSKPILTDQSFKNACDINNIMAQYAKTGLLPQGATQEPRYIDNTQIPTLEEAYRVVNQANQAFYDLPATIRRLLDNDPSQLENFVANPENREILEKHGLIVKKSELKTDKMSTGGTHDNNRIITDATV